jgi:branched-chain amino acid transport system permease protein
MEMFLQTLTNGVMTSLILILIASGLCIIFGILHIVNFAHGEFYMLGGFLIWWLFEVHSLLAGLPDTVRYIIAMIISMAIVGFIGIIVEKYIYRPFRNNLFSTMIVALGIMFILQASALVIFGARDKAVSSPFVGKFNLGSVFFSAERLAAIACGVIFIVALYFLIDRTKIGKAMRAVAQDPEAALVQGINIGTIFTTAMGISCALAAAGGALVGPIFYINPYMGVEPIMKAFVVVILGGLGSLPGAVIGGFVVGITESFVTTYVGAHFAMLVVFLIMIGTLIAKPTGIFGHAE